MLEFPDPTLQGWQVAAHRDTGRGHGDEHAVAFQLPMLLLLQQHSHRRAGNHGVVGKMPTTRVRRLITALPSAPRYATLTRTNRLVLQKFNEWFFSATHLLLGDAARGASGGPQGHRPCGWRPHRCGTRRSPHRSLLKNQSRAKMVQALSSSARSAGAQRLPFFLRVDRVRVDRGSDSSQPLRRRIRKLADQALDRLNPTFCSLDASEERPSVPPEQLLLASLPQALDGIRSERLLLEHCTTTCCTAGLWGCARMIRSGTPPHPRKIGSVWEALNNRNFAAAAS